MDVSDEPHYNDKSVCSIEEVILDFVQCGFSDNRMLEKTKLLMAKESAVRWINFELVKPMTCLSVVSLKPRPNSSFFGVPLNWFGGRQGAAKLRMYQEEESRQGHSESSMLFHCLNTLLGILRLLSLSAGKGADPSSLKNCPQSLQYH